MNRKFLVAYDGSDYSKKAIEEAKRELILEPRSELHIVTVAEKVGPQTNKAMSEAFTEEMYVNAKRKLSEAETLLKADKIPFISQVIRNEAKANPAKSICDYAEKHDIDRIIMGSRGLGNIKSFFMGSVSNEILKHATCPVLIIK